MIDLGTDLRSVNVSSAGVLVEVLSLEKPPAILRQLYKYDQRGKRIVSLYASTEALINVSDTNREYSIDGVKRTCNGVLSIIVISADGELVLLHDVNEPSRNVLRYNTDGTLRWQLAPREYRPRDAVLGAHFLPSGNVLIVAWDNGWTAEVDDRTGVMLKVVDESYRF